MDPSDLLRGSLLTLSRSTAVRSVVENAPVSRSVVARFVAGDSNPDAVQASQTLVDSGRLVTIDYLGEDTTERAQADHTRDVYLELLAALSQEGLTQQGRAEVSVKLSALGQALDDDGDAVALDNARQVCQAAADAGTTVTVDMEDHTTVDSTLSLATQLREDFPWVGVVLQSGLKRTEADCADFAGPGSRVRLCKGAYASPASVAYTDGHEVDASYVRCMKVLMGGQGYPMLATHDPRLIEIGDTLAREHGRARDDFEFQMLFGIRPEEQKKIAGRGDRMRVYIPFGDEWYGYLMRRMAERPANAMFFLRALATKS